MAWAPIAAAGLQAGGSLLGGMLGAAGQSATNAQQFAQSEMMFDQTQTANQHFMDQSEAYNTLMSNTQYQRTVEDMMAAGLNPILAAGQGPGSMGSSPTASVSPVGTGTLGNPGAAMGAGISSAAQAGALYSQMKAVNAQADKDQSATNLNDASTETQKAQVGLTLAGVDKAKQETATSARQASALDAQAENSKAQAAAAGASAAYDMARTATEGHNAVAAEAIARTKQAEAFNAQKFGPGFWGDLGATATRSTGTAATGAWDLYSKYIGQPFSNAINYGVSKLRGGTH